MVKVRKYFLRHRLLIWVLLVLILAALLRAYRLPVRWGLAFDQAHDVLVAREALRQKKIPILGPFASGANMVGGPQWYWVIAFFSWLSSDFIMAPWIGLALLSVLFVGLMMRIGFLLGGKKLAIIVGLLAAFSPLQISQSANLTNQSPMALITAVSLWAMVGYFKSKKPIFAFLLGTGVALGINVHLQGGGLIFLLPAAVYFGWKHQFKSLFLFLAGFTVQFIPMLIFELRTNFYNFSGLLSYFLYEQKIRGVSTRWLTYLFQFWPDFWRKVAGGDLWSSYLQGIGISLLVIWKIFNKKISKHFLAMVVSFILIFISLRYYRGPRYESYFVFIHPFILFFSAWFVYQLWQRKKVIGGVLLIFLLLTSFRQIQEHYRLEKNNTYPQAKAWQKILTEKYPDQKFALFDYDLRTRDKTASLALVLSVDQLIDDQGVKIGISNVSDSLSERTFYRDTHYFSDLSELEEIPPVWRFQNPSVIWRETQEWYLDEH